MCYYVVQHLYNTFLLTILIKKTKTKTVLVPLPLLFEFIHSLWLLVPIPLLLES